MYYLICYFRRWVYFFLKQFVNVEHTAAISSKLNRLYDKVFCRSGRAESAYMNFLNIGLDITDKRSCRTWNAGRPVSELKS